MGAAALPLMIASTVISAAGAAQAGNAQSQALQYQAQVAANNQIIANQYADRAIQVGQVNAETAMEKNAQQQGVIRAAAGASGFQVDNGTNLRLQEDTAKLGQQDISTIMNNAQEQAYGYQVQGLSYQAQSQLDTMSAANASQAGDIKALGSIFNGASAVSSKWSSFFNSGITDSSANAGDSAVDFASSLS